MTRLRGLVTNAFRANLIVISYCIIVQNTLEIKMANVQINVNDLENLNDEEFLLLYNVRGPRNTHLSLPHWKYDRFQLEEIEILLGTLHI